MDFSTRSFGSEPDALDVQVLVDRLELFAERDEVFLAAQQPPQQARELDDEHAGGFRLRADERRDGRQRVEQEMRVDLAGQGLDPCRHEQLLLLLQPVLDARAVPDLDRDRDAQHRGQHDERGQPQPRRLVEEDAQGKPGADGLTDQFQDDGRRQQDDHPVDLEPPDEPPHVAVQVREEQRREVPDGFLRADFAQAAAGKPAADGERKGGPFAGERRRQAHHGRHDGAGVGSGEEPREKGAGQRQVGGLVVEEQPDDTPAVSGRPRLAANTSRSGQSRFSVSRIRRNHGTGRASSRASR
jgi:hypothetical protein